MIPIALSMPPIQPPTKAAELPQVRGGLSCEIGDESQDDE